MARQKVASKRVLCKVVSSCLGKSTPKYLALVKRLEDAKGPEFVVRRLKALQAASLKARAGDLVEAEAILRSARIRVRKDKPYYPKGVEGVLMRNIVEGRKPSVVRRNLMVTRMYTGLYLQKPSKTQIEKARKSINSGTSGEYGPLPRILGHLASRLQRKSEDQLRLPAISSLGGSSRYPEVCKNGMRVKSLDGSPYESLMRSMLTKGIVPQPLLELFGDNSLRKIALVHQEDHSPDGILTYGKISFLQEGGCKGRVVCQPNGWVQLYMRPLHNSLMQIIHTLEQNSITNTQWHGQSCVTDQNRGGWVMKEAMESGKEVTCFDLSSATDRFPLSMQTSVLNGLGYVHYSKALEELKGPYDVNTHVSGRKSPLRERWSYSTGQPMGLNGSFPLFHLTHFLLLEQLCEALKLDGNKNFAVLGDDVLITNKRLASLYQRLITRLGVEISKEKSFSGNVSEFAGFLAVKSSGNTSVFRPFKWGNGFHTDGKEVNLLYSSGKKVWHDSPKWNRINSIFESTLPQRDLDLTPLLPSVDTLIQSQKAGSRWFEAVLEKGIEGVGMADDPLVFHLKNQWKRLGPELLMLPGEQVPLDVFNPKLYLKEDRIIRKDFFLRADPLIRLALRESNCKQVSLTTKFKTPVTRRR